MQEKQQDIDKLVKERGQIVIGQFLVVFVQIFLLFIVAVDMGSFAFFFPAMILGMYVYNRSLERKIRRLYREIEDERKSSLAPPKSGESGS